MMPPVDITSVILFVLVGILVVAHLCWWLAGVYFPNSQLAASVHLYLPLWWRSSIKQFKEQPGDDDKKVTVLGFTTSLIWPFLVSLNILLLAQVFELFFDGGSRIPIPLVGTYAVFPLIMAALYAVAQCVLGIIFGHSKSKGVKTLFLILIIIAIAVEMGLAGYRASLLSDGATTATGTIMDQLFLFAGPILAAFIGMIVPVVEISLGYFAFGSFFEPLVPMLMRWTKGIVGIIGSCMAWLFFGFHNKIPVILPGWVTGLRQTTQVIAQDTKRLQHRVEFMENDEYATGDPQGSFGQLKKQTAALVEKAESMKEANQLRITSIEEALNEAEDIETLNQVSRKMRGAGTTMAQITNHLIQEASQMERNLLGVAAAAKGRQKTTRSANDKNTVAVNLEKSKHDIERLENAYNSLSDFAADLDAIYHDKKRKNPILLEAQVDEIKTLMSEAKSDDNKAKKDRANDVLDSIHDAWMKANNLLPESKTTLTNAKARIEKLEHRKESLEPVSTNFPDPEQIDTVKNRAGIIVQNTKLDLKVRQGDIQHLDKILKEKQARLNPGLWQRIVQAIVKFFNQEKINTNLPSWAASIDTAGEEIRIDSVALQNSVPRLEGVAKAFNEGHSKAVELVQRVNKFEAAYHQVRDQDQLQVNALLEKVHNADNRQTLLELRMKIREFDRALTEHSVKVVKEADQLKRQIKQASKKTQKTNQNADSVNARIQHCENDLVKLVKSVSKLQTHVLDLDAVMSEKQRTQPVLLDTQVEEIHELLSLAANSENTKIKAGAKKVTTLINQVRQKTRVALDNADVSIADANQRLQQISIVGTDNDAQQSESLGSVNLEAVVLRLRECSRNAKNDLRIRQKHMADIYKLWKDQNSATNSRVAEERKTSNRKASATSEKNRNKTLMKTHTAKNNGKASTENFTDAEKN